MPSKKLSSLDIDSKPSKRLPCEKCDKTYIKQDTLDMHMKRAHPESKDDDLSSASDKDEVIVPKAKKPSKKTVMVDDDEEEVILPKPKKPSKKPVIDNDEIDDIDVDEPADTAVKRSEPVPIPKPLTKYEKALLNGQRYRNFL